MTSLFIFPVTVFLSIPAAIVINYFVPPLDWLWQARLNLVHIIFLVGAMAFPFPLMLVLAGYTGLWWDLVELPMVSGGAELRPGWSCLAFALSGATAHSLRELCTHLRWEVHCLGSALFVIAYLLFQYVYLSWVRGEHEFSFMVWGRIGGSGVVALFAAPVIYFFYKSIMQATGYKVPERQHPAYQLQNENERGRR